MRRFLFLIGQCLFAAYPEVDYFTRLNSTSLGANWVSSGGFDVFSQNLRSVGGTASDNNNMAEWSAGSAPSADHYAYATTDGGWGARSGSATGGVGFRLTASSENGYSCMIVAGNAGVRNLRISRWDAGTQTTLASGSTSVVTIPTDSIVIGWAVGTTLNCSLTDSAGAAILTAISTTDATYSTGRPGVVRGGSSQNITWITFWGGNGDGTDVFVPPTMAGAYYASATSTTHNAAGTAAAPWPFLDFFANQTRLPCGSTLWFKGGTYNPDYDVYFDTLAIFKFTRVCTAGNVTKFAVVPGEYAIFDANTPCADASGYLLMMVTGDYLTFDGGYNSWEWTNSDTSCRVITRCGSNPDPSPIRALTNQGNYITYRGLNFHDLGDGLGGGAANSKAMTLQNMLVYNIGWNAPDRGHGHGGYLHNVEYLTDRNTLRDTVAIRNQEYQTKIYSASGNPVGNWLIDSVAFIGGNGASEPILKGTISGDTFLVQGGNPVNITINKMFILAGLMRFNVDDNQAHTFSMTNSIIDGGIDMNVYAYTNMQNNVFSRAASPDGNYWYIARYSTPYASTWAYSDYNTWYNARATGANFSWDTAPLTLAGLQTLGQEANSTYISATYPASGTSPGSSATNYINVLPSATIPGTGNVIIYNWKGDNTVTADVGTILSTGDPYEVIDLQCYSCGPIATGTYTGGTLSFDMTLTAFEAPYGNYSASPGLVCEAGSEVGSVAGAHPNTVFQHTEKYFGVFMVRRRQTYIPVVQSTLNTHAGSTQITTESGASESNLTFPSVTVSCAHNSVCQTPFNTQLIGNMWYRQVFKDADGVAIWTSGVFRVGIQ